MLLARMPALLTWTRDESAADEVLQSYLRVLSDRLAELVAHLRRTAAPSYEALVNELDRTSDRALIAVLAAPLTSRALLRLYAGSAPETADFLIMSLRVERVREGGTPAPAVAGWTAGGDAECSADGTLRAWPRVPGLTVDYGSPHARGVDIGGWSTELEIPRQPPAEDWITAVATALRSAVESIAVAGPNVHAFVTTFNRVVVAQPNPDAPERFSSGSTRRFIGRSTFGNPHVASPAVLANALVHEGIHALLYMQSIHDEWVLPDLDASTRIVSPWTAAALEVEPFLQACFVWYGLLHFWSLASATDAFAGDEVNEWMEQCVTGFLKGPLVDAVRDVRGAVSPDVLATIAVLQERVVDAYVAPPV